MDIYLWTLLLGAVGLASMAIVGISSGHAGGSGGHAHSGGSHAGHAHAHTYSSSHGGSTREMASRSLWTITSPRFLFSVALGSGATGLLLRPIIGGPTLVAVALAGGIVFERALVTPLWNFLMRFASKPAQTLESAVTDEATVVTTFDRNGQGIVSFEVDGQVVQILATLRSADRELPARVRAGQRVRIDDVDVTKNSCTVSLL